MQLAGILAWWVLMMVLGAAAIPLAHAVFRNLPDRGYAFTKPLGLLAVGLLGWLLGYLHFSAFTLVAAALILAALSAWLWRRDPGALLGFLRQNAGYILVVELFFLVLFLLFLAFRMYNPDIIGTEKFMDLAFLNAISRAGHMPPYDPWLAGEGFSISYYYFGYLLMAVPLKLSAIPPAVGFNLALGLLFALSGTAVFGVLYNLTRRLWVGFAGWGLITLLGNLDGARQALTTGTIANFNWWTPSRVVPDTINEFPFFSFLLGDMHPHMLAVPFTLLTLAFGLDRLRSEETELTPGRPGSAARFALWGVCLGALGFLNSWDLPIYFFIAALALAFQQVRVRPSLAAVPWRGLAAALGIMLAAAVVPYLPFYLNFHSQAKGLALTTQNTRLDHYLLIFGTLVYLVIMFLAGRYHHWFRLSVAPAEAAPAKPSSRRPAPKHCAECGAPLRPGIRFCGDCGRPVREAPEEEAAFGPLARPWAAVPEGVKRFWHFLLQPAVVLRRGLGRTEAWLTLGALGAVALAMFFKSPFLGLMVFLLLAMVPLLAAGRVERPETLFVLLLTATAWLLSFGAEVLHINDTFQPPLDRMNTVFKFYYQVWYLLGLAGAYGAWWLVRFSLRRRVWRLAWAAPLALLAAAALVYPYAAVLVKTNHFAGPPTLDGSAYLNNTYRPDREGIEWLRAHARGTPVVLEATGGEYTDFARVSTFTGLPTVLGWAGHELQWRGNYDEPSKRIPDIDTLYSSNDPARVRALLDTYRVEYVFVGTLEREKYPNVDLGKFAAIMDPVFQRPGITVYRRR